MKIEHSLRFSFEKLINEVVHIFTDICSRKSQVGQETDLIVIV
jgi:hypothetical protein